MQQFELPDVVMPVRRYLHPATGGRVTFVGMIHAAQPQYFAQVRGLIEQLQQEGAGVFFEPPMQVSPQQLASSGRNLRKRSLLHRKAMGAVVGGAGGLGLVLQADHLPVQPDWETPDASALEQAGALDWRTRRVLKAASGAAAFAGRTMTVHRQKVQLVQSAAARVRALAAPAAWETVTPGVLDAVAAVREGRVMAALDARCAVRPDCHVVLVWGTEHLPGFGRALDGRGYKIEGEDRWLTAIDAASFLAHDAQG